MAKGKSRRGKEDRKPKQKKTKPVPAPSFSKGLTIETVPKAKKA
ncbi:hypothetical protein [Roseibium aggregatum]|uniref:Uncharacterized protein n=1 Tax=Roseibium aggregatum (strain ATCC 25650 / DSM 13394 / JCM 20685 / NBRC 16684 / NCIMB 2208 / IAM 12614 / B1) TaxID=384765 RepID=A0P176_ROSAI|nr:hypothetical protein [Roseibium aggregatum]EAV41261.1 hypothetical protein SIAM614_29281 [Stappia aggregata IAM 12614] [Roseibium aggregatum IAM 12614]